MLRRECVSGCGTTQATDRFRLLRTGDLGRTWTEAGFEGRLAVADDKTMWIVAPEKLWGSRDGGATWQSWATDQTGAFDVARARCGWQAMPSPCAGTQRTDLRFSSTGATPDGAILWTICAGEPANGQPKELTISTDAGRRWKSYAALDFAGHGITIRPIDAVTAWQSDYIYAIRRTEDARGWTSVTPDGGALGSRAAWLPLKDVAPPQRVQS